MKKLLSLSAGIVFAGFITAQAIPNGGFENWSNVTWHNVSGYENSNDQNVSQFGASGANVTQGFGYTSFQYLFSCTAFNS